MLEKPLADHEKLPTPQEILAFYDSGELHQQPQQQRKQDTEHQTPQVYGECSEGQGGFTSMAQQQAAAGRSGAGAACSAGATGTRSHVSCHGAVDGSALGGAARKVQKQQLQAQEQGRQQKQAPLLPEHLRVSDHKVDFGSKVSRPPKPQVPFKHSACCGSGRGVKVQAQSFGGMVTMLWTHALLLTVHSCIT